VFASPGRSALHAFAFVLALVVLAGCGSDDRAAGEEGAATASASATERCVDRILGGSDPAAVEAAGDEATRAYIEETYCGRFAERGWVYDDGALSIEAFEWVEAGYDEDCGAADEEGSSQTVPCDEVPSGDEPLQCGILRHVRNAEVEAYLAGLPDDVECDNGTPLDELGVPDRR
jgi:hypothetical protein